MRTPASNKVYLLLFLLMVIKIRIFNNQHLENVLCMVIGWKNYYHNTKTIPAVDLPQNVYKIFPIFSFYKIPPLIILIVDINTELKPNSFLKKKKRKFIFLNILSTIVWMLTDMAHNMFGIYQTIFHTESITS